MRGKPKPTKLKLLHGEKNKDRIAANEVDPPVAELECPAWLSPVAAEYWDRAVAALHPLRLLTTLDGDLLSQYCEAWSDFHQAREIVEAEGSVCENDKGSSRQHPAMIAKNQAAKRIKELAGKFGMSPVDRVGLDVPKEPNQGRFGKYRNGSP